MTGRRFIKDDNLSSFSEGDRDSGDYCTEDAQSLGVENSNDEEEEKILPNVSRRMVEERERRAIKLMEESFSQVNQKVRVCADGILFNYFGCCCWWWFLSVVFLEGGGSEGVTDRSSFDFFLINTLSPYVTMSSLAFVKSSSNRQPPKDKKYSTNYSKPVIR